MPRIAKTWTKESNLNEMFNEISFWEKKLQITHAQIVERMNKGDTLELQESEFRDPGPDWSKLLLGGEVIAHANGY